MSWERGEAQRGFWWWSLPPSLPVAAGREALWREGWGTGNRGNVGQGRKVLQVWVRTGLCHWDPQEHSSVGRIPAGADTHFSSQVHPPPSPYWREMPEGFIKNQWKRKGWGLNCTWYSESSSTLCILLSCLKVSIYLYIYICAQCNQVTFETVSWAANYNFQENWQRLAINT